MAVDTIIFAAGLASLLTLGFFVRPEPLAYLFVTVYLLFPKFINLTVDGKTVNAERALELPIAAAVVISLIRNFPKDRVQLSREARVVLAVGVLLVGLFAARAVLGWGGITGAPQTLAPFRLPGADLPAGATSRVPVSVGAYRQLFALALPAYGLLFFYLGLRFFRSADKVESLFRAVIACGVVGSVEGLFFPPLGIAPNLENPGHWHFIQAGLTLGGRDMVTRTVLLCVVAVVYFLDRPQRNNRYLLLLPLLAAALLVSVQVTAWIAAAVALGTYAFLRQGVRGKVPAINVVLLLCALALAVGFVASVSGLAGRIVGDNVFASHYKLGLWSFQLAWTRWSFPFGLGAGAVPFYFAHSAIGRFSSGHNLLLEFVTEYGLLGIIGLIACAWLLARSVQMWRRDVARDEQRAQSALLAAAVYSMLIGELVLMQIDSTVRMYFLYMLLVASAAVLSGPTRMQVVPGLPVDEPGRDHRVESALAAGSVRRSE